MLWRTSALKACAIEATDGRIGTVSDFLFDDASWMIRWLVVDTGNWLSGRKVLLPPSVLGHADAEAQAFHVNLTKAEVKASPETHADLPVSRQFEADVYRHYGWSPYWGGSYMGAYGYGGWSAPMLMEEHARDVAADKRRGDVDPHLRSVEAVTGYHLHATDGEFGHVSDFLVEDADWSVHFLVADTRNWWPGDHVLISPGSIGRISWDERLIHVEARRERIKSSPSYDPAVTVDRRFETRVHDHYGDAKPLVSA